MVLYVPFSALILVVFGWLSGRTSITEALISIGSFLQQLEEGWYWYGHVLRKEDDGWVKKCMKYEVEGYRNFAPFTVHLS